ncbi:hypothetical protein [Noviherbaspirillum saxi]|uniref:Uncharacterized protein n=1 Tax=Noviherbaspirillum saxi TaxID=2320863 RepID=A0A3A3FG60_9BURK|nr:hypothetical protein [Noviherbaspirillum saxi]RJF92170.1 hypothetical protein D3871_26370 [Noviherbaspirillum saxi]
MSDAGTVAAPDIGNNPNVREADADGKPGMGPRPGSNPSQSPGLDPGSNPMPGPDKDAGPGEQQAVTPPKLNVVAPDAPHSFILAHAGGDSGILDANRYSLSLDPLPLANTGEHGLPFELATVAEWRMLVGNGVSSGGLDTFAGQYAVVGSGTDSTLSGLAGAIVENAGVSGPFTIDMPRLGIIDGYVQLEPHYANVWLSPRNTATRMALQRARGDVEREASRHAGFDIQLTIV